MKKMKVNEMSGCMKLSGNVYLTHSHTCMLKHTHTHTHPDARTGSVRLCNRADIMCQREVKGI